MASKKRGGLSKREFKRAQAAKAKPVVRKSSSSSSKKSNSNYMDTEGYTQKIYNALPANSPAKISAASNAGDIARSIARSKSKSKSSSSKSSKPKVSSNRSLASKALGFFTGAKTANAQESDPGIDYNKATLQPTYRKQSGGIVSALGRVTDPFGIKSKLRGAGFDIPSAPDLGISERLGLSKKLPTGTANYTDDQGRVLGPQDQLSMYDYRRIQDEGNDPGDANIFVENRKKTAGGLTPGYLFRDGNPIQPQYDPQRPQKEGGDFMDTEGYTEDIFNALPSANNPYTGEPADAPLVDTPFATQGNRSGRGAGLFGTGMGVGNPAGEDDYLSMLRKSMKGYGRQEDDVMRQFKNLIKALDPTYDEYEKDIKDELGRALWNNNTSLASVMNANNTGDSEQRAQLMAGQQRDNQSQLGDLLRKLLLQKNEDINKYKTQSVDAVNQIRDRKMSAQERYAQAVRQYQQEQQVGSRGSGRASTGSTKLSHNDIFNWTQDAIQKGYTWQEIADNAVQQGIGTETDGYLDKLLRNAFGR